MQKAKLHLEVRDGVKASMGSMKKINPLSSGFKRWPASWENTIFQCATVGPWRPPCPLHKTAPAQLFMASQAPGATRHT